MEDFRGFFGNPQLLRRGPLSFSPQFEAEKMAVGDKISLTTGKNEKIKGVITWIEQFEAVGLTKIHAERQNLDNPDAMIDLLEVYCYAGDQQNYVLIRPAPKP